MSDSSRPHELQPTRHLHPWDFPGKSTRQEYWSGLSFPTPGDLSNPGVKPAAPALSALAGRFFTTEPPAEPLF